MPARPSSHPTPRTILAPESPMPEIRNIGGYLDIDEAGFIVKKASPDAFQQAWKPVIADAVEAYKEHFGKHLVAAYVRGSAAKGEAIDGLSDLDTIAIVDLPPEHIDTSWKTAFNAAMAERYPFVEGVEILAITPAQAKDPNRGHRIMLKTQSACVFGLDISDSLPPIRIGKDAAQHAPSLVAELEDAIVFFGQHWGTDDAADRRRCSWAMKRILRTGFELVMERERKYTRDLYPCFEGFSRHYPEMRPLMRETLERAINPTADLDTVLRILRAWLRFMPEEIERIFGAAA